MEQPPVLNPLSVIEIGEQLDIEYKKEGFRKKWKFNPEQRKAAVESCRSMAAGMWMLIAKGRQVGMSTYFCLEDVLWTVAMSRAGLRAKTAIILDTDLKAAARLDQCQDFLKQINYPHRRFAASNRGPERIEIEDGSGSFIHSYGTFGSRVGSSLTYNRFHISELPYWKDPANTLSSLLPTLTDDGYAVCESTMDTTDPTPESLWKNRKNRWRKVFCSYEEHEGWTMDPARITDEKWEELQDEGFTDRGKASHWYNDALMDKCAGDLLEAFHMYPQTESHLFRRHAGRFIKVDPYEFPPTRIVMVEGVSDAWPLEIYANPDPETSYVIAIDTAEGKELDRTVVSVIDRKTSRLAAIMVSDEIWFDDTARVAKFAYEMYSVGHPYVVRPPVLVEENGPGAGTVQACRRLGLPVQAFHTTEGKRHTFLVLSKRAVESRTLEGPSELATDVGELWKDDKGRWKGRKDVLMACGMGLELCMTAPHVDRPEARGPGLISGRISRAQKAAKWSVV